MAAPTEEELANHPPIGEADPVPRVPRPKGWGFPRGQVIRIAMFASLLVGVIMLRKPCSDGVGSFVDSFEAPIDAAPASSSPRGGEKVDYVRINADDDPDTVKRKIDRIRGVTGDAGAAEPPE